MGACLPVSVSLSWSLYILAFFELTTFCVFQVPDVCQIGVLVFTRTFTLIYDMNKNVHVMTPSTVSKCYMRLYITAGISFR